MSGALPLMCAHDGRSASGRYSLAIATEAVALKSRSAAISDTYCEIAVYL